MRTQDFYSAGPTISKSINALAVGFSKFLSHFGNRTCYIKGDGEKGFKSIDDRLQGRIPLQPGDDATTRALCHNETYKRNVKFWLKNNKNAMHLTNSYVIVDSVIRVMRNLCGKDFANRNVFFATLKIYNNTLHSAFDNRWTPTQVQSDPELECAYICGKEIQLAQAELKQAIGGLSGYSPGNIVLVHTSFEKTRAMFKKQRRNFSALATFINYEGPNAHIRLMKPGPLLAPSVGNPDGLVSDLVIPVFYTKIICEDASKIPAEYKSI
jgi:hypothetical protein